MVKPENKDVRQPTPSSINTPQREINAFRDQARYVDKKSNLSEKL